MNRFLLYAALLLLTQCSKCKTDDPKPQTELEKLPPATQTGANTFGCLINGQAFIPRGSFSSAGLEVSYDPAFGGGGVEVRARRLGNSVSQELFFGREQVIQAGTYSLSAPAGGAAFFDGNRPAPCQEYRSADLATPTYCRGTLTITRLDVAARVVAGTFELVLAKPGCDTIKITNGRFDKFLQ